MARSKDKTFRCELCDEAFETNRSDAVYCCNACRQLAHRIRKGRSIVVRSRRVIGRGKFLPGSFTARSTSKESE